ncbi:hypothetical protein Btru_057696 [Bulinus truncatus]|nr:hypothetical protein Btru_057696 [Bulinus truncatus]
MDSVKINNDPWTPLTVDSISVEQSTFLVMSLENPLHQELDSEKYIRSLETKLNKLTKVKNAEPSARDIISSLTLFHDDQMKRYVDDLSIDHGFHSDITYSEEFINPLSYVQRKLHPEKQPLCAEELLELLKEDILAKTFEDSFVNYSSASGICDNKTQQQNPQSSHISSPDSIAHSLRSSSSA